MLARGLDCGLQPHIVMMDFMLLRRRWVTYRRRNIITPSLNARHNPLLLAFGMAIATS
jgi:hypothetical protein